MEAIEKLIEAHSRLLAAGNPYTHFELYYVPCIPPYSPSWWRATLLDRPPAPDGVGVKVLATGMAPTPEAACALALAALPPPPGAAAQPELPIGLPVKEAAPPVKELPLTVREAALRVLLQEHPEAEPGSALQALSLANEGTLKGAAGLIEMTLGLKFDLSWVGWQDKSLEEIAADVESQVLHNDRLLMAYNLKR